MTTIAWDGKTLAADSQCSMFNGSMQKLFKLADGRLYGACGQLQDMAAVRTWLDSGGEKPKVSEGFYAIVIDGGVLNVLEDKLVSIKYDRPFFAVGSGRDYAMAAMLMGATARRAVEVAAKLDTDTGGEIHELSYE